MKQAKETEVACKVPRERRYFSEQVRRDIVKEIDEGLSKADAGRRYQVSQQTIYKWLARYSLKYQKALVKVVEHESESVRARRLEAELNQAYAALGRTQAELLFLEEVLKKANEFYETDLKKSFDIKPATTFTKTEKNIR